MMRVCCDRCGKGLRIEGANWDTDKPENVRGGISDRGLDLCPECAEAAYQFMAVYVMSQGGYRSI
jgi:hypothetical protein